MYISSQVMAAAGHAESSTLDQEDEEEPPANPETTVGGKPTPPRRLPRKVDRFKDSTLNLGSLSTESWSLPSSENTNSFQELRKENATLKAQLNDLNKARCASEEKCQSLSAEYADVKQKLIETAQFCQNLVTRLEAKESGGRGFCEKGEQNREAARLRQVITQLRGQLEEVTSANKKWQSYNEGRETYIKGLLKTVEQLKQELQKVSLDHVTVGQQQEIDKMLLASKAKITALEEDLEKLEDENRQLRIQTHQNEEVRRQLEERVRHLEAEIAKGGRGRGGYEDEYVQLLQEQVRTVTEDFEAERRDREIAQSKISDLERELQCLRIQMAQNRKGYYDSPFRTYYRPNHTCGAEYRHFGGRTVVDGLGDLEADGDTEEGHDDTDANVTGSDVPNGLFEDGADIHTTELLCPRCLRQYGLNQEAEFQEHIGICCD
ncbi:TNFAIP3-interacting protein 2-like isoform X1 [Lingula anatina]|uniref:TNFAIP3-interacting protein 2-like isoform X1 n=2 Tax=Lingula anatina TaxID=7574 RepID=A0A1S3JFM8_LINAN|nr:TNFAIP3-interacting protein 2-like isoform X1 [Lingula anatina]|eukprot:XP_013408950.1 TNFAIP3-interacting protein 2-like isoform X1 [Lingula anatina]